MKRVSDRGQCVCKRERQEIKIGAIIDWGPAKEF